jgi:hypothetical protein
MWITKEIHMRRTLSAVFMLSMLSPLASAQVITVTTLEDVYDTGSGAMIADLPGPDGVVSFREAVYASNNELGGQTIEFAIPESEFYLETTMALLRLEDGPWSITDDGTVLDFTSQARNIGETNPDGPEVGVYGWEVNGWGHAAILVYADNCTIKGLGKVYSRASSVDLIGSNNRVIGCDTLGVEIDQGWQGPPASGNIIGGTQPGEGNTLGFVDILSWADDNVVVGNKLKTMRVAGSPYSTFPKRNRIGGPTLEERNIINGFGSRSGEGYPTGQGILVNFAQDTLIQNNYIGVNEDGTERVVQIGPSGIEVRDSISTEIYDNLISGIWVAGSNHSQGQVFGSAIRVTAINRDNEGVIIQRNKIGTDATGELPIQTRGGIVVAPFTAFYRPFGTLIGGPNPEDANIIAFTETIGVSISSITTGVKITGNPIFGHAWSAIELVDNWGRVEANPNDPLDADNGANGVQNHPIVTDAMSDGTVTHVEGLMASAAHSEYTMEFFASPDCPDPTYGQGRVFLGRSTIATDSSGEALFSVELATPTPEGWVITATAIEDATGNTSEFSACTSISIMGCAADMTSDGQLDVFDVFAFLDAYESGDPAADHTGDGTLDVFDVFGYLDLYNAGCP